MKLTAFDISEKMIEQNMKLYQNIQLFIQNIYEPLGTEYIRPNKNFDLIVCCEALEHMEQPEKAAKT